MDFDGSRYYTLNRMMLSSIGLWPYQNMWHIRIQRISCLFCVISCIITQLCQIVILPDQRNDLVALYIIFIFCHFYYMFICNFMGQKVIDSSTEIFRKAYDTQWYMAPLQMQKLLLFMMQRSMKSCNIVMGGLYFVSLEQFTTMASRVSSLPTKLG
ncbi:PREDICTED: uncharacterized protein LOC105620733 [Atta cephalotes]|uniref:Odorant receptor n=1 Tax=Atta cephalotes TaxID=12957 RepID=A0A158NJA7_ATTCE|nr:PREDICTED: uncharacterized protein LOC105620733 [Atta cephalotes]